MKSFRILIILFAYRITLLTHNNQTQKHSFSPSKFITKFKNRKNLQVKPLIPPKFHDNPFVLNKPQNHIQISRKTEEVQENQPLPLDQAIDNVHDYTQTTGDPNIDSILQGISKADAGKPIIIINHKPQIQHVYKPQLVEEVQDQQPEQQQQENQQQTNNNPDINETLQEINNDFQQNNQQEIQKFTKITTKDIPILNEVLQNIMNIYQIFFGELPSFEQTEKSKTQKAVNALRFYAKLRNFVLFIIQNKNKLQQDVYFLSQKSNILKSDERGMLEFYELDYVQNELLSKYNKLNFNKQTQIKSQIDNQFNSITALADQFNSDIIFIQRGIYDITQFTQIFLAQIQELQQLQHNSIALNVVDKIDDILMTSYRLMELKENLFKSFDELKQGLVNISSYKGRVMLYQKELGSMLEVVRLTEKKEQEKIEAKNQGKILMSILSMMILFQ